jgi:hypothetical protein
LRPGIGVLVIDARAGGGVTCMVERFDVSTSMRLRAFHDKLSPVFPDGTVLTFGAGELRLKSDEWFHASAVVEIFLCLGMDAAIQTTCIGVRRRIHDGRDGHNSASSRHTERTFDDRRTSYCKRESIFEGKSNRLRETGSYRRIGQRY